MRAQRAVEARLHVREETPFFTGPRVELTEWAQRFAASTGQRVGVETGLVRVSAREADDLLRDAETFVDLAARRLGVPGVQRSQRLAPVRSA